jgi:hypothetical protein
MWLKGSKYTIFGTHQVTLVAICSCQSEQQTQEKQIKALHEYAAEAWGWSIL